MAKLGSAVVNTSLVVPAIASSTYTFEIREVEDKTYNSGATGLKLVFKIIAAHEPEGEGSVGRTVIHNIVLFKSNGEYNEISGRELRNLIVAAAGEDAANDEDFDTDSLQNTAFIAQLKAIPQKDNPDQTNYSFSKFMSL